MGSSEGKEGDGQTDGGQDGTISEPDREQPAAAREQSANPTSATEKMKSKTDKEKAQKSARSLFEDLKFAKFNSKHVQEQRLFHDADHPRSMFQDKKKELKHESVLTRSTIARTDNMTLTDIAASTAIGKVLLRTESKVRSNVDNWERRLRASAERALAAAEREALKESVEKQEMIEHQFREQQRGGHLGYGSSVSSEDCLPPLDGTGRTGSSGRPQTTSGARSSLALRNERKMNRRASSPFSLPPEYVEHEQQERKEVFYRSH